MVWPTLGPRTAKEQNIHSISPLTLLSRMNIACGYMKGLRKAQGNKGERTAEDTTVTP